MSRLQAKPFIEGTVAEEQSPDFSVLIQMDPGLMVSELLWDHSEYTMKVGVENGSP